MATLIMAPTYYPMIDSRTIFLRNFRAHQFVAGGMRNVLGLRRNLDFRIEAYAFIPVRNIREVQQLSYYENPFTKIYLAGSAAFVYHSPVGPLSVNLNYYDDPSYKLGVFFSFGYLIFHNRSIY